MLDLGDHQDNLGLRFPHTVATLELLKAQLMISPLIVMFSPLKFQPLISNVSAANSLRFRR